MFGDLDNMLMYFAKEACVIEVVARGMHDSVPAGTAATDAVGGIQQDLRNASAHVWQA